MNSNDLECLAKLLDKNHDFVRPKGQVTGYSCDENCEVGTAAVATSKIHDTSPHPMSIPLPPTVIDQQLRLPVPSHSKVAEKQNAMSASNMQPRGEEIWSQAELKLMYDVQSKLTERKNTITYAVANKEERNASQNGTISTGDDNTVVEPEYRILYQQQVRAEDVYLGVDFTRDSSVASSEAVVIKVELPLLSSANDISINLQPFHLKLSAPHYYLSTPLPTEVNDKSVVAKWDTASSTLTITCTVVKDPKAVKILS